MFSVLLMLHNDVTYRHNEVSISIGTLGAVIDKYQNHRMWLEKSHLKFERSRTMGTQTSVMTRASSTRLELARWFPQFIGKISKHQRCVARQMAS